MAKGTRTGGRKKGTPNRTTSQIRAFYAELVSSNLENVTKWIDRIAATDPDKALNLILKMSEYVLPKLRSQEITVDKLSTEDLKVIVEKLIQSKNE